MLLLLLRQRRDDNVLKKMWGIVNALKVSSTRNDAV